MHIWGQVKKIRGLKRAFETFEEISDSPGKGAFGQLELRVSLRSSDIYSKMGRDHQTGKCSHKLLCRIGFKVSTGLK